MLRGVRSPWAGAPPSCLCLPELRTSPSHLQHDLAASPPHPEGGRRLFDTHAVVRLFEENGWPRSPPPPRPSAAPSFLPRFSLHPQASAPSRRRPW